MTDHEIPPDESVWAAGCVVARDAKKKPKYLVIHRPRYRDWSLPKGKLDAGETFLQAAVREVEEETGIAVTKPRPIGTVGYMTKVGNAKVVRWWLATPDHGSFTPNGEVDEIKWLSFEKAMEQLSYRNDKAVLDRANDMQLERSAGMIHLVRHGWAGIRDDADPNDAERPLDDRGRKQRDEIGATLMAHPITRIGSSNFPRCVQTVAPLAARLGIPIEREAALIEGSNPRKAVDLIHELQEEAAVLCSHGDVIAALIGHLFAKGVPLDGPMAWDKGSIWQLRTVKGQVVSGRYLAPTV
ncbi:MAG: NUDIX hydrolase [Acidimicrobiia bacterium]